MVVLGEVFLVSCVVATVTDVCAIVCVSMLVLGTWGFEYIGGIHG